jgi:hypothetical protein
MCCPASSYMSGHHGQSCSLSNPPHTESIADESLGRNRSRTADTLEYGSYRTTKTRNQLSLPVNRGDRRWNIFDIASSVDGQCGLG